MDLEASDRLIDIIWVNWMCTWENQKKSAKTSEFFFSKCLKVPRSSVQTIVCKYEHHGTMQPSYRSGRRHILSPRYECILVRKVQINPRTTAKDHLKMLEETITKVSISTLRQVLYRHNLKGRSARRNQLLQNPHKKARLRFVTAHVDKDHTFWRNVLVWWKNI